MATHTRTNTIHLPDNLRARHCECGDRAIHDAGTCARCGKSIPAEVLIRHGLAPEVMLGQVLDELLAADQTVA